ncbi:hypothetical protein Glove_130g171 [Diversispora epigaea]|uniref:Uncharacterized protein n=1 Tax=Diversispora epigaea TaxID=1348612 RepID=A0A397J2P9_9GLOM|nr:hypothetical protein Glove_130g171 [Diversispora epigaea]
MIYFLQSKILCLIVVLLVFMSYTDCVPLYRKDMFLSNAIVERSHDEMLFDSQERMYARSLHIDWNDSELDELDWTEWTRSQ